MARGRQTRTLTKDQIERLEKFRRAGGPGAAHGYSLPQLRLAMDAHFGWATLKKALAGLPVWELHWRHIVQFLDRYVPAAPLPADYKAAAAGDADEESEEQNNEAAGAARTLRGSR